MKTPVITHNTNTIMTLPFPRAYIKFQLLMASSNDCRIFFYYGMSIKKYRHSYILRYMQSVNQLSTPLCP